ncbi:MAG: TQO small subunit DoxA domain-containing protein [Nitrososphaeria archaeon]
MNKFVALLIIGLVIATGFTMVTYQVFFSGFTDLHNLSKTPAYDLNGTQVFTNGTVLMQIARVDGPDTYGGFIVLVQLIGPNGSVIYQWNAQQLGTIPASHIHNLYPLHPVKADKFALVVPLGQNASVELQTPFTLKRGTYTVRAYDVDDQDSAYGINFQATVKVIS